MEKSNNSILPLRDCIDSRKDDVGFPCAWLNSEGKCKWMGDKVCKPIRIDWYKVNNIDSLRSINL